MAEQNGFVKLILSVRFKDSTCKDLTAVYYHRMMGRSWWAIEGYKEEFQTLEDFATKKDLTVTDYVEINRSHELDGVALEGLY